MSDLVTLVTGANSGIGLATALHLAERGRRVVGTSRTDAGAERLRAAADDADVEVGAVLLDVAETASVDEGVARVVSDHGPVAELVNNAGVAGNGVVEDLDPDVLTEVLDVNVVGVLRCCRAVLPGMRSRGAGTIVNISSGLGRVAGVAQAPYVASKWALEGLSEELAHEVSGFGVRVAIVEPGVTRTPIFRKNSEAPMATEPYRRQYARMFAFYAEGYANATPAAEVAATVRVALDDPTGSFRRTVSWGADELVRGRASLTDEEWVALGALDDVAYAEAYREAFGIDLAPHLLGEDVTGGST